MTQPATISPDTATDLLSALSRLVRTSQSASRHTTQTLGATNTGTAILKALARAEASGCGDRPGDLAEAAGVAPSVVSRALVRLEQDGLVDRTPDETDARCCHIGLTEHGRSALAQAQLGYARQLAESLGGMTDAQAQTLAEGMTALERAISTSISPTTTTTQQHLVPAITPAITPALTVAGSTTTH